MTERHVNPTSMLSLSRFVQTTTRYAHGVQQIFLECYAIRSRFDGMQHILAMQWNLVILIKIVMRTCGPLQCQSLNGRFVVCLMSFGLFVLLGLVVLLCWFGVSGRAGCFVWESPGNVWSPCCPISENVHRLSKFDHIQHVGSF